MIINSIASLINDFIVNLYNSGIHFYQIILGMFIFNVIIYYLMSIVREAQRRRLY